MSCDIVVWNPKRRLTAVESAKVFERICKGDLGDLEPSLAIAKFYAELSAKHPEIDDVSDDEIDDKDLCPWTIAHERSDAHIVMSCLVDRVTQVGEFVIDLAAKHGLAVYDPQSRTIFFPDGSFDRRPWWRLWD